ncbi:hypothetical protein G7Y89_g14810 [Cudoniella acicularis]|uniref:Uncharacterized protein n=1 Tax=Cudoniella acicularis TaxID=354080 RepID=A0A8H4QX27_9HELO|nr:hypothetical protein G7Y89_g14810 [Cudoniella acicularis]
MVLDLRDRFPGEVPWYRVGAEHVLTPMTKKGRVWGLRNIITPPYTGIFNYSSALSDPEAQALSNDLVRRITKELEYLKKQCSSSEDLWAPYDNLILAKPFEQGALEIVYNRGCLIMHGSNYGKWKKWDAQDAHSWNIVGFPNTILILQSQMELFKFLRAMADNILKTAEKEEPHAPSNIFLKSLSLGIRKINDKSNAIEFVSMYLNQPFSAPPKFDLHELRSIAQTRLNMHGDHLWLLQTDPAYTRRYTTIVLAGTFGETLHKDNRTGFIVSISETGNTLKPEQPLPAAYAKASASLEAPVGYHIRRISKVIEFILPSRPRFCYKFKFDRFSDSNSGNVGLTGTIENEKSNPYENFFSDHLYWCLTILANAHMENVDIASIWTEIPSIIYDLAMVFAVLEQHVATCLRDGKSQELARFDPFLYSQYADLAALHQIMVMIRLHRPQYPKVDFDTIKNSETTRAWRYVQDLDSGKCELDFQLLKLLKFFLSSPKPTGSRFTRMWLGRDMAQRKALHNVWSRIRERHTRTITRLGLSEEDAKLDLEAISADLNLAYIASVKAEHDEILAGILQRESQKSLKRSSPSNPTQTQWGSEAEKKPSIPEAKIKAETRPNASSNDISAEVAALNIDPPKEPE